MATDKRERQRAAREAKVANETTADKRARRTRTGLRVALIVGAALVAAFAYSMIFGGSSSDDEEDTSASEPDETEPPGPAGEAFEGRELDDDCPPSDGSAEPVTGFEASPPWCIDVGASYVAEIETSEGAFSVELDPMEAPLAVNNFVVLARSSFYDGSTFHRVIEDFVVQGGDPVGEPAGTGNPGYNLGDDPDFTGELPREEPYYPVMSVAMANSGDPGTAGSQFFVVTGPEGESLPLNYTRFGQVTAGDDVVMTIESEPIDTAQGVGEDVDPVVIEKVTIAET